MPNSEIAKLTRAIARTEELLAEERGRARRPTDFIASENVKMHERLLERHRQSLDKLINPRSKDNSWLQDLVAKVSGEDSAKPR